MSGFPNAPAIAITHALIAKSGELRDEILQLRATIKQATLRMRDAEEEFAAVNRDRHKEMERMDLTSSGNTGYENRMTVFLTELIRLNKPKLEGEA